jgi:hypothetical protein
LALPLLLLASIAWAGSSDGTAIDWSVLGGGGAPAESSSGVLTLNGTLGQTAIGSSSSPGATLGAGFCYGLRKGLYRLYLPVVLRNF